MTWIPYDPGPEALAVGERIDQESADRKPGWQERIAGMLAELDGIERDER